VSGQSFHFPRGRNVLSGKLAKNPMISMGISGRTNGHSDSVRQQEETAPAAIRWLRHRGAPNGTMPWRAHTLCFEA
jgi:hypothetical protein